MTKREKITASKWRKTVPILFAAVSITAACILISMAKDPYAGKIMPNTSIAGVDVGGMTRGEARKAMAETARRLSEEDMVVVMRMGSLILSPETYGVQVNVRKAVNDAYARGCSDAEQEAQTEEYAIGLMPYLELDEEALRKTIQDYAQQHTQVYSDFTYTLEGSEPSLEETQYVQGVACQTLVITMGTPSVEPDAEVILEGVLTAYDRGSLRAEITTDFVTAVPQKPDVEAIYQEVCTEPVDASLDMQTYEYMPARYGYGFHLRNADYLVTKAGYGETVRIPMETTAPSLIGDAVYFRDILGFYNSGHSGRLNIVNNLELVCQFLDGTVIQPGEVFSYNDVVGERTVARGFMFGDSFSGFAESSSPGGGVCQGSSVLYVCALLADLEIVERVNHGMTVGYTPLGQDAAVSWPDLDFRFRNNTHFPIKITAELSDGAMRMQILGTDEKDYYIELESTRGQDDHQIYARCYNRKYDKATGELLSRELASHSAYRNMG